MVRLVLLGRLDFQEQRVLLAQQVQELPGRRAQQERQEPLELEPLERSVQLDRWGELGQLVLLE
jgi:hypothetical protein